MIESECFFMAEPMKQQQYKETTEQSEKAKKKRALIFLNEA